MPNDLTDPAWLTAEATARSARSIARELGVSPETVLRAMRLHGIPTRFGTSPTKPDPVVELNDPDWLSDRYASASAETIARELEVHPSRVRRALERHRIPTRGPKQCQKFRTPPELDDDEWLRSQYRAGNSGTEIADELGVSRAAAYKAMRRCGIDTDGPWVRRDTTRLRRPTERQLRSAWHVQESIKGVARQLGVAHTTAAVWLADVGIFVSDIPAISRDALLSAIQEGMPIRAIARDRGMSDRTVMVELRRHGLREQHRRRPSEVTTPMRP